MKTKIQEIREELKNDLRHFTEKEDFDSVALIMRQIEYFDLGVRLARNETD